MSEAIASSFLTPTAPTSDTAPSPSAGGDVFPSRLEIQIHIPRRPRVENHPSTTQEADDRRLNDADCLSEKPRCDVGFCDDDVSATLP